MTRSNIIFLLQLAPRNCVAQLTQPRMHSRVYAGKLTHPRMRCPGYTAEVKLPRSRSSCYVAQVLQPTRRRQYCAPPRFRFECNAAKVVQRRLRSRDDIIDDPKHPSVGIARWSDCLKFSTSVDDSLWIPGLSSFVYLQTFNGYLG